MMRVAMRVVAAVALLAAWAVPSHAGGRKRIVVVEFEGPKADKFHDDIVRLIKKTNTVVPYEKWSGAAEELDASKITDKNVKKVARKLKVDGIVTGKIEKRRDEYIIQIKLRAGTTGEIVGNRVDTKADGPRIEGQAGKDIKEELLPAIEGLEANHGGGGDDEEDSKPAKKKDSDEATDDDEGGKHGSFSKSSDDARGGDKVGKKSKGEDDEADAKPVKKTKKELEAEAKAAKKAKKEEEAEAKAAAIKAKKDEEAEAKAAKKAKKDEEAEAKVAKKTKKDDDDAPASTKHDEDESPLPETKKRSRSSDEDDGDKPKKKVAKKDDDDDGGSTEAGAEPSGDAAAHLSVSERALDVVVGMSFMARSLKFKYDTDLATPPPGYSQSVPVAGAYLDVTAYPLAWGHKRHDLLAGLGFSVLYDRVLVINSQKSYLQMDGTKAVAKIATAEARFGIGAVLRYPLGKGATAPVVGARLGYIGQQFAIGQTLPNGAPVDIPNVSYSIVELGGFVKYPVTEKIVLNLDASILPVLGSGDMTSAVQYGKGSVLGFQFAAGGDYLLTKNIFVRASLRLERIGFSFDGTGKQATMRDADTMQDVQGATDMYYGGTATVGYLY